MLRYGSHMPQVDQAEEMIRVRLSGELKDQWRDTLAARKITQQKAIIALLEFVVECEPSLQLLLFGQVDERDVGEVQKLVLKRLADKSKK